MARIRTPPSEKITEERPPLAELDIWRRLRSYVKLSIGSQNQSRLPLRDDTPPDLLREALAVSVRCVCGNMHHPVRTSKGSNEATIYATGPRDQGHKSCSHGVRARAWIKWIKIDIGRRGPGTGTAGQAGLWA